MKTTFAAALPRQILVLLCIGILIAGRLPAQDSGQSERLVRQEERAAALQAQTAQQREQIETLESRLDQAEKDLLDLRFSRGLIAGLGITSLASLVAVLTFLYNWSRKFIQSETAAARTAFTSEMHQQLQTLQRNTEQQIAATVSQNEAVLKQVIEANTLEYLVRERKSLLVISSSPNAQAEFILLFSPLKFKNVTYEITDSHRQFGHADLVIFNELPDTLVQEFLHAAAKQALFVNFTRDSSRVRDDRMGFANTIFTLYGQVINAFKYDEYAHRP